MADIFESNLSDKEKEFVSELKSELLKSDMNSVAVDLFVYNAVALDRLIQILDVRTQIRAHDKKYIKGSLSISEWQNAEKNYDPIKELLGIFGDPLSGKSNGKDK